MSRIGLMLGTASDGAWAWEQWLYKQQIQASFDRHRVMTLEAM